MKSYLGFKVLRYCLGTDCSSVVSVPCMICDRGRDPPPQKKKTLNVPLKNKKTLFSLALIHGDINADVSGCQRPLCISWFKRVVAASRAIQLLSCE